MPTPNNTVTLKINGRLHSAWSSYKIDSSLMIPADAWQVELGLPADAPAPERNVLLPGTPVEVLVGEDTVMTGRIDDISHTVSKQQHVLSISGRDGAALLLDCSASLLTTKQVSLKEFVVQLLAPFGIPAEKIRIQASAQDAQKISDKIEVNPEDSPWAVIERLALSRGLWPWFDPDGTLVIGGPDYSVPPVATLVLRRDGSGNNVLSLSESRSMADSYSQITVRGQGHGTLAGTGRHDIKASVKDTSIGYLREKIYVDPDVPDSATAQLHARKKMMDARIKAMHLTALVQGHRTSDGKLWQPGQRVTVISEPHQIAGTVYFLMARCFEGGRQQGALTTLTLKEDGVWLADAHGGKLNSKAQREIIDVA